MSILVGAIASNLLINNCNIKTTEDIFACDYISTLFLQTLMLSFYFFFFSLLIFAGFFLVLFYLHIYVEPFSFLIYKILTRFYSKNKIRKNTPDFFKRYAKFQIKNRGFFYIKLGLFSLLNFIFLFAPFIEGSRLKFGILYLLFVLYFIFVIRYYYISAKGKDEFWIFLT